MYSKKIHLLGLSYGEKPAIILDAIASGNLLCGKEMIFYTDSDSGVSIDICRKHNITYGIIDPNDPPQTFSAQDALLVVIGWNKLLPASFLQLHAGCMNCHGGLLPDYRGNNTYMHSYAHIETCYGATIHYVNEKFDDGNIIIQGRMKLYEEETPRVIHRRISELTAYLIPSAVHMVETGYTGIRQQGKARYFEQITRQEMESLRTRNLNNIREGRPIELAPFREWELD